jgi:hypothetical protein
LIPPTGFAEVAPDSAFSPLAGRSTLDSLFAEIFAKLLGAQDQTLPAPPPFGPASTLTMQGFPDGAAEPLRFPQVANSPTASASEAAGSPNPSPVNPQGTGPVLAPYLAGGSSPKIPAGPSVARPPFSGLIVDEAVPEFTLVDTLETVRAPTPGMRSAPAVGLELPEQSLKPQAAWTSPDATGRPPASDVPQAAAQPWLLREVPSWERTDASLPRPELSPSQAGSSGWVWVKGGPIDGAWKATTEPHPAPLLEHPAGRRLTQEYASRGDGAARQSSQALSAQQFAANLRREGLADAPAAAIWIRPLATEISDSDADPSLDRAAGSKGGLDEGAAILRLLAPSLPTSVLERGSLDPPPERAVSAESSVADRNALALARMDRVEFVQRIVQALERARAVFPETIEVELNPPALGKMRIQVTEHQGEMVARIQAESANARTLIVEHLPNLDRQLGEHGVQIQRIHVDPMNTAWSGPHGDGGTGDDRRAGREQGSKQGVGRGWREDAESADRNPRWTVGVLLGIADGMDVLV